MTTYGIRKDEIDPWTMQAFANCNIATMPPATLEAILTQRGENNGHYWLFQRVKTSLSGPSTPVVYPHPVPSESEDRSVKVKQKLNNPLAVDKSGKVKKKAPGTSEKNKRALRELEAEVALAIKKHPDRAMAYTVKKPVLGKLSMDPDPDARDNETRRIKYAFIKSCVKWHSNFLKHLNGNVEVTCVKRQKVTEEEKNGP